MIQLGDLVEVSGLTMPDRNVIVGIVTSHHFNDYWWVLIDGEPFTLHIDDLTKIGEQQ